MNQWKAYFKENLRCLTVVACLTFVTTATMLLNDIPLREIGYGLLLCLFVAAVAITSGYSQHCAGLRQLEQMKKRIEVAPYDMKPPESMYERLYQDCVRSIAKEKNALYNETMNRQQDLLEYYSMWVHQIKTPIAALKLLIDEENLAYLDEESIEENQTHIVNGRKMQHELFLIEQYVDMALQYTRLGSRSNDFVIQKINLDDVIKSSVHKYAKQFIHKKLRLIYVPQGMTAITDKKWLGFVIDQLLSNAIKYTKQGSIAIQTLSAVSHEPCAVRKEEQAVKAEKPWYVRSGTLEEERVSIVIEDTGIGIRAEDLPRVCEQGYTGYNGHSNQYSTGIGLYLCKKIVDRLGHKLVMTSEKGKGTRVEIVIMAFSSKESEGES